MISPEVKKFFQRWTITTLAVAVAANVVNGIRYDDWMGLLTASLLLGILNAFLRPLLLILSLPLLVFSLGLFTFVINAFLLFLVGNILQSFRVATFGAAFWGGVVISLVSLAVNIMLGIDRVKVRRTSGRKGGSPPPSAGGGPVIDV
ncbi:MAG: phage holin family protein [Pedosphaera sp.]|nr:phage holin family protein [Pedosphaera sp.]